MYLKSIEMQGFKSFAGKMKLEFNDGITAIVGPNGSGKSNISDAVRWVLGEQSAKQLRGGNMQDVIFAGTASRRPLGFAFVSITFDNSDHTLDLDFEEVTISRRLFRSGESEYLINGSQCRLKDIQELFYDTGIGKEGYSMIGQGQIDRILSGRPEERRELLDEAAGIVKFKRRKNTALKKLLKEEENLVRVTDILSELQKRVGPLERQSQKARIYLSKKEELKEHDLNLFVSKEAVNDESLEKLSVNFGDIIAELNQADREYEAARAEYESIEKELEDLNDAYDMACAELEEAENDRDASFEKISALKEEIRFSELNIGMISEQISKMTDDMLRHEETLAVYRNNLSDMDRLLAEQGAQADEKNRISEKLSLLHAQKTDEGALLNNRLIELINEKSSVREKIQRFTTLDEQNEVQTSALNARMIRLFDVHKAQKDDESGYKAEYEKLCAECEEKEKQLKENQEQLGFLKEDLNAVENEISRLTVSYHRSQSMLESLLNIAERYEGFGNSVKKVMEQRDSNPGIMGAVAELISTSEKYETAVETALGGSLQNIVTDNEATAKYLIEFLKRGRYGRATFLPLTTVGDKELKDAHLKEKGVLGRASELVECDSKYKALVNRLLGRTYIIDTIDNAILIGRKHSQKYRMVTLEGELINPGGSMTGGSYKNNSNLLGRQRQIDELRLSVGKLRSHIQDGEEKAESIRNKRALLRTASEGLNDEIAALQLKKNTAENNLDMIMKQASALSDDERDLNREKKLLAEKRRGILSELKKLEEQLSLILDDEKMAEGKIAANEADYESLSHGVKEAAKAAEEARAIYNSTLQKKEFIETGIRNILTETDRLKNEIEDSRGRSAAEAQNNVERLKVLEKEEAKAEGFDAEADGVNKRIREISEKKDDLNNTYKNLFKTREELSEKRNLLDKESFRLESMIEKLESEKERFIEYLRDEYEITPLQIDRSRYGNADINEIQKEISRLKAEIKALGSVNVNALDEYKEVKARYEFLMAQHSDLMEASEKLKDIIAELDKSMRRQFAEEFANINREFRKVFKELFGGGEGRLELVDEGDILEAGIRVIAQPPGKKLQNMMQLSGGEKTLTAIALLFAIQNLKPSPFVLLDEIEAALDDGNVDRVADYLHRLADNIQFVVITHRRGTMTAADRLYGITMQEKGVSAMVSVDLIESKLT